MLRHLKQIMNVSLQNVITKFGIINRAGLPSKTNNSKGLRGIGHVHRIGLERLLRQLLYSLLKMEQQNQGRPSTTI